MSLPLLKNYPPILSYRKTPLKIYILKGVVYAAGESPFSWRSNFPFLFRRIKDAAENRITAVHIANVHTPMFRYGFICFKRLSVFRFFPEYEMGKRCKQIVRIDWFCKMRVHARVF